MSETSTSIPVLKIGAVIVHPVSRAILIMQAIPKNPGEVPAFVLPRGSRQYSVAVNGMTEWHDARDEATGVAHAATLEPFMRGLMREIEEEAGVTETQLAASRVIELGDMLFQSRTKGVYPIHWFIVVPEATTAEALTLQVPVDALSIRWATLEEIKAMGPEGFSAGYIPVIEAALQLVG